MSTKNFSVTNDYFWAIITSTQTCRQSTLISTWLLGVQHFINDKFKCIYFKENVRILIHMSLKFLSVFIVNKPIFIQTRRICVIMSHEYITMDHMTPQNKAYQNAFLYHPTYCNTTFWILTTIITERKRHTLSLIQWPTMYTVVKQTMSCITHLTHPWIEMVHVFRELEPENPWGQSVAVLLCTVRASRNKWTSRNWRKTLQLKNRSILMRWICT